MKAGWSPERLDSRADEEREREIKEGWREEAVLLATDLPNYPGAAIA